ncbi:DUF2603 domain-containing protein [Campylobacter lanienae]|uniref:DUF2603 domain-containing protein n=1 Tax=Campylobacter lanienae TaxID=75658 RepID=UPI000BB418DD|nr:DUF2603 domain-containing protein [Campylobacter lanienae]
MNSHLENISQTLGISKRRRTTFELEPMEDNQMKLSYKGRANFDAPWFGMNGNKPCALVPAELFEALINALKNAQKENFELKLERSILQNLPIDFGDVWTVAIEEIKKANYKKEPNLDRVIAKIKKEHPNLFLDMRSLVNKE